MAPYMVEVFEDDLFISFYRNYTVMKVSKFRSNPHSLEDAVILFRTLQPIGDILILQPSKQKKSKFNLFIYILTCVFIYLHYFIYFILFLSYIFFFFFYHRRGSDILFIYFILFYFIFLSQKRVWYIIYFIIYFLSWKRVWRSAFVLSGVLDLYFSYS